METIKKKPLIDLNLSPERIQEIDIKTNPFDHLKKQIFEYTEDKEFGVGIEIELNGKYKLNRLSYLQLELPINFSNISPECLLVAEVKDSLGNITSWEKVRLMDYYSDLGEWQNELVRIPVTAENGTKLKCYIWNNGMNSFRVKPFKTWLNRVQ